MTRLAGIFLAVIVVSMPVSGVFASDFLPLPQSIRDLLPQPRRATPPAPAPSVTVAIPEANLGKPLERKTSVLRLAPGKSQTVSLDRDAASVIVANPAHATVFLDNPRLLVIVPRTPGATSLTVLDNKGKIVLDQPIVINESDDAAYVRVTRICGGGSTAGACVPVTTYYCPDNCVPVSVPVADNNVAYPTIPPVSAMPALPLPGGTTASAPQSAN